LCRRERKLERIGVGDGNESVVGLRQKLVGDGCVMGKEVPVNRYHCAVPLAILLSPRFASPILGIARNESVK